MPDGEPKKEVIGAGDKPLKENADTTVESGVIDGVSARVATTLGTTDVDKVMERLGKKVDMSKLEENNRVALKKLIGESVLNPDFKPEEDPAIIEACVKQLKAWGHTYEYGREEEEKEDGKRVETDNKIEGEYAHMNRLIRKKRMPTLNYPSYVRFYQYDTQPDEAGGLLYTKGVLDTAADDLENHIRISGDRGGNWITSLWRKGLRGKASIEGAMRNATELGLGDYFEPVMEGEKIVAIREKVADVNGGLILDDLLRARAESDFLQKFDQKEAIAVAVKMIEDVHKRSGRGVGEILGNDIVIQVSGAGNDTKIAGARLTLPDITFEEGVSAVEQKAMDLTDLCMSVGCAGWQEMKKEEESRSEENAKSNIETVISNYDDKEVKAKMLEILKAGRPFDTIHNRQRFGFDTLLAKADKYARVKGLIIEALGG